MGVSRMSYFLIWDLSPVTISRAEAPWRLAGAHKQGRPPGIDVSRASALAPTGGMKPRLSTNDPRVRQLPIPEHSIPSSCRDVY